MTRLGLVPLDERPVNLDQPLRLARAAGAEFLVPPREWLGWRERPGDPERLLGWLEERIDQVEGWVLSLDMLLHGGLVASRDPEAAEIVAPRLARLRGFLREASSRCHAFLVLPRGAGSVFQQGDLGTWAERDARGVLPASWSASLGWAQDSLELVSEGGVDFLAVLQEDSRPGPGLEAARRELLREVRGRGLAERVVLTPGADEAGQSLVVRLVRELVGAPAPRVRVHALGSLDLPAPYEPVSLIESLRGQWTLAGVHGELALQGAPGSPGEPGEPGEIDLVLWAPAPEGRDLWLQPPGPGDLGEEVERGLPECLRQGTGPLAVADLVHANGGSPAHLRALARELGNAPDRLRAYAGWNTAANTLGSCLALLGLAYLPGGGPETWGPLRNLRLLEDVLFQARVRGDLGACLGARGLDPWNLPPEEIPDLERELCGRLEQGLGAGSCLAPWVEAWPPGLVPRLPWARLFEIGLGEADLSRRGTGGLLEVGPDRSGTTREESP